MRFFWGSFGHWGSYGLKQGTPLQNFQFTTQIIIFLFSFLCFSFLYQKVYQRWDLCLCEGKYVSAIEEAMAWNRGIPCKKVKSLIKLYLLLFCCYIRVKTMAVLTFGSIELEANTHPDDDDSTLSGNISSQKV